MSTNIEGVGGGGGLCSMGEDCAEYKNLAFLLVSLGITVILVGALFYYVRQRFEVLEVSHKEQIGVMRNFISSIGEQFQRMSMVDNSILHSGGSDSNDNQEKKQNQMQEYSEDRLSVSSGDSEDDDDDDDVDDDDSNSSDTDIIDAYNNKVSCVNDIIFCNDGDAFDEQPNLQINDLSDIKIIELCRDNNNNNNNNNEQANAANGGGDNDNDDDDDNDDDIDDDDDSDDDDDDSDDDSDKRYSGNAGTENKRLIVIKTDGIVSSEENEPSNATTTSTSTTNTREHDRNMVIDLDLDMVEDTTATAGAASTATSSMTAAAATTPTYAQMTIKQLRQSVKRLTEHKNLDTSKLKRDQLIAMLS